jgi:hypothetical protein
MEIPKNESIKMMKKKQKLSFILTISQKNNNLFHTAHSLNERGAFPNCDSDKKNNTRRTLKKWCNSCILCEEPGSPVFVCAFLINSA